jgi:hypothetical protein
MLGREGRYALVLLGRHAPLNFLELAVRNRLLAPGAQLVGDVHVGFERLAAGALKQSHA